MDIHVTLYAVDAASGEKQLIGRNTFPSYQAFAYALGIRSPEWTFYDDGMSIGWQRRIGPHDIVCVPAFTSGLGVQCLISGNLLAAQAALAWLKRDRGFGGSPESSRD